MQDLIDDLKWLRGKCSLLQRDGSVYFLPGPQYDIAVNLPHQLLRVSIEEFVYDYLPLFNYIELEEIIRETKILEGKIKATVEDIFNTKNQEFRRQLIRLMGFDTFVAKARPKREDKDGSSELLRIKLKVAEDIMVVKVVCPSTGDTYLLRVPPTMKSCQEAIAWTFGLEADKYYPKIET